VREWLVAELDQREVAFRSDLDGLEAGRFPQHPSHAALSLAPHRA